MQFKEIGPGAVPEKNIMKIIDEAPELPTLRSPTLPKVQSPLNRGGSDDQTALPMGCNQFKKDYQTPYAYVAGAMGNYRTIQAEYSEQEIEKAEKTRSAKGALVFRKKS